ncbi:hypothetical protein Ancab_021703 [Ancistrocladus abbreviatus]
MKSLDIEGSRSKIPARKEAGRKLMVDTGLQTQGTMVTKSYKEALLRSGPREKQNQQLPALVFKTRNEESTWLKDCYVGQVRAIEHVNESTADEENLKRSGETSVPWFGNSIGDSNIANMNRLYLENQVREEARRIWEMGKSLGATYKGEDEEVIEKLVAMDKRDLVNKPT